jgi:homoserine O-acetyltransferase
MNGSIVLASAPKLAAQGIAFNAVGRRAIYADAGFANGKYYDSDGPRYGLALARMIAHITYLSEDSIELKFGRRLQDSDRFAFDMQKETEFQIESYLHYQGKRFVQRFDANSYLYLTRAMDYFDLSDGCESLTDAVRDVKSRFLVASYDTDWLFPTSQSKELVSALLSAGKHVSFIELACPFGHDSFLIDLDPLMSLVSPFLEQTQIASRS